MKKKLTLLFLALFTTMGAWADVKVSHNPTTNGAFSNPSASLEGYYTTWTSNATSGVSGLVITTGGNLAMHQENISNYGGNLLALATTTTDKTTQETVTITAPTGFLIKGYSLKAQLQSSANDAYRVYDSKGGYYSLNNSSNVTKNIKESFTTLTSSFTLKIVDLKGTSTYALCFTELYVELVLPVDVNDTNGSFTRSDAGSSSWKDTWTANSTIAAANGMTITVSCTNNNSYRFDMNYDSTLKIATGGDGYTTQYTITAPSGYIIDSYKITGILKYFNSGTKTYEATQSAPGISFRANESLEATYFTNSAVSVSPSSIGSSNAVFTLCGNNLVLDLSEFKVYIRPISEFSATTVLTNQITRAQNIINALGSAPGEYSIVGDLAGQKETANAVLNDGTKTAAEKAAASTALYNIIKTAKPNYPASGFYRIYAKQQNVYVKSAVSAGNTINTTSSTDNSTSIFYLENTDAGLHKYKMLSYANGQYLVGQQQGAIGDYGTYRLMIGTLQNYFAVYGEAVTKTSGTSYSNYTGKAWFIHQTSTLGFSSNVPTDDRFNVKFEPLTSLPITMNTVDDKNYFATIKLPVAVEIPSRLSAYSAVADGTTLTLTKVVENGVLKANTPVILYSTSNVESLTISNETGASPTGTNELSGTIAAASVTANQNYVLSSGTEGVGFYKYNNTVMPGFKAYLPADAKSNVKAFTFSFEDAEDAIRAIESENSGLEIYDISGRRVQKAQKGLYIVNGKKVMYK